MFKMSLLSNTINNERNILKERKNTIMLNSKRTINYSKETSNKNNAIVKEIINEEPKMLWGAATWYLLHSIAEKIKDDYFLKNKEEIMEVIFTICTNLPCSNCSEHAKKYLTTTVKYKTIRTREELKMMLYNFHNYVNSRKNYTIFSRDELDKKYSLANMKNIINNFIYHYQEKSQNVNFLAVEMNRSRILIRLKEWFKNNIYYFL